MLPVRSWQIPGLKRIVGMFAVSASTQRFLPTRKRCLLLCSWLRRRRYIILHSMSRRQVWRWNNAVRALHHTCDFISGKLGSEIVFLQSKFLRRWRVILLTLSFKHLRTSRKHPVEFVQVWCRLFSIRCGLRSLPRRDILDSTASDAAQSPHNCEPQVPKLIGNGVCTSNGRFIPSRRRISHLPALCVVWKLLACGAGGWQ